MDVGSAAAGAAHQQGRRRCDLRFPFLPLSPTLLLAPNPNASLRYRSLRLPAPIDSGVPAQIQALGALHRRPHIPSSPPPLSGANPIIIVVRRSSYPPSSAVAPLTLRSGADPPSRDVVGVRWTGALHGLPQRGPSVVGTAALVGAHAAVARPSRVDVTNLRAPSRWLRPRSAFCRRSLSSPSSTVDG